MKYVVLYEGGANREKASQHFPEHRASWKQFQDSGELLMIGPFADPQKGAMSVFKTRAAAERFVAQDPFVREGVVTKWEIREWREAIVPEA